MRAAPLALLFAAPAVVGCLGSPPDEAHEQIAGESGALWDPIEYVSCEENSAILPVDATEAAGWLPDGFAPSTPAGAPGPANLVVVTASCAGAPEPLREVLLTLQVEPPADLQDPAVNGYFALLGVLTSGYAHLDAFAAWGVRAVLEPELSVTFSGAAPTARTGTTSANDGNATLSLKTVVAGPGIAGTTVYRLFGVSAARELAGVFDTEFSEIETAPVGGALLRVDGGALLGFFPPAARFGEGHHAWGGWTMTPVPDAANR